MIETRRPGRVLSAWPGRCSSRIDRGALVTIASFGCLAVATAACRIGAATPLPTVVSTPGDAPLPPGVAEALAAPTRIPPPPPAAAIPFRLRPVPAPRTGEQPLGVGAWAADGRHVVAFTREAGAVGADVGRVWIVDAGAPTTGSTPTLNTPDPAEPPPAWAVDSGDVVGAPADRNLAAWRSDGRLMVARSSDAIIATGGEVDSLSPAGPDFQSMAVTPDGATTVAADAAHGWLFDANGNSRPVSGYPAGVPADAWAWRFDSAAAAALSANGGVWVLDPSGPSARQMSPLTWAADRDIDGEGDAESGATDDVAMDLPIWLAGGRLLIPRPVRVVLPGGPAPDLALVDPATGVVEPLRMLAQLPPYAVAPPNGGRLAAPGGAWVLAPRIVLERGRPAVGRSRLVRADGDDRRDIQPVADPHWAPNGQVLAYVEAGTVAVYDPATGRTQRLLEGAAAVWWSPDSRRLAVAVVDGGLVIVERDGGGGPTRILDGLDATLSPSWSADGRRLAVVRRDAEAGPQLVIIDLPLP